MSAMKHEMTLMITTESLSFGTFVVDDSHRIISWNEVATRTLGYDSGFTLGRTCEEILTLLDAQNLPICPEISDLVDFTDTSDVADSLSTDNSCSYDPHSYRHRDGSAVRLRVVTQDGMPRWLDMNVLPARKLDGTACVAHIFRDVTEGADYHGSGRVAAHVWSHPGAILQLPLGTAAHDVSDDRSDTLAMSTEHLTPREHEVLELLAQGMATIEIATALGISRVTARNHVTRIIEKLGVRTRLQAVLAASRLGLV
jgi:DNA-binding CsgD family transcriptional regulator